MTRRGFTLIELMLVIVIMGVVYTLSIKSFHKMNKPEEHLSLSNFRNFLYTFHHQNRVELICTDRCRQCEVFVDKEPVKEIKPFFDDTLKAYYFDPLLGSQEIEFQPYFDKNDREKDVCFRYEIAKDGVSDEMMVEYKERVYDLPSYLGKVQRYDSIEEAVEAKRLMIEKVNQ